MNKFYQLLIFIFISTTVFSQGIAVQGIARDNTSSAITNTTLTFTFSITQDNNTVLYAETQSITTDNFGIFSHIVSTGNPTNNTFANVDFEIENLKLKVSVNYNGNTIEVYNQTFQYTPYAHYAKKAGNGVPTGSVMPFLGTTAPEGWVLCDGRSLTSITGSEDLRVIVGDFAPNLQGMFLRGTGTRFSGKSGPAIMQTQDDSNEAHTHNSGTYQTDSQGSHNHGNGDYNRILRVATGNNSPEGVNTFNASGTEPDITTTRLMLNSGAHIHDVQGVSGSSGGTETRPVNYGVNYIIKL